MLKEQIQVLIDFYNLRIFSKKDFKSSIIKLTKSQYRQIANFLEENALILFSAEGILSREQRGVPSFYYINVENSAYAFLGNKPNKQYVKVMEENDEDILTVTKNPRTSHDLSTPNPQWVTHTENYGPEQAISPKWFESPDFLEFLKDYNTVSEIIDQYIANRNISRANLKWLENLRRSLVDRNIVAIDQESNEPPEDEDPIDLNNVSSI